jgi:acyl transferase domain-containing protein
MITMPILLTIATIAGGTVIGQKINGLFANVKTSRPSPEAQIALLQEALADPEIKAALIAFGG